MWNYLYFLKYFYYSKIRRSIIKVFNEVNDIFKQIKDYKTGFLDSFEVEKFVKSMRHPKIEAINIQLVILYIGPQCVDDQIKF